MSTELPFDYGTCAICNQPFQRSEESTVRQSWIEAGGWGTIPVAAIVHPRCDAIEMNRIKFGLVRLSDLWVAPTAPQETAP